MTLDKSYAIRHPHRLNCVRTRLSTFPSLSKHSTFAWWPIALHSHLLFATFYFGGLLPESDHNFCSSLVLITLDFVLASLPRTNYIGYLVFFFISSFTHDDQEQTGVGGSK